MDYDRRDLALVYFAFEVMLQADARNLIFHSLARLAT